MDGCDRGSGLVITWGVGIYLEVEEWLLCDLFLVLSFMMDCGIHSVVRSEEEDVLFLLIGDIDWVH